MIKGLDYSMLAIPLIATVQDHENDLAALTADVEALKVERAATLAALDRLDQQINDRRPT